MTLDAPGFDLVVFDLDGTLIDSRPDIAASLNVVLAERGHASHAESEIEGMIGEGARSLAVKALAASTESAISEAQIDELLHAYVAHYSAHPVSQTRVYPGVREGLATLASSTVKRAVATNKPGPLGREVLRALGLLGLFDVVLGDGDVPQRKPDPAMLEAAMTATGVRRAATLYVGDGPVDLQTARRAGVPLCLVSWGYRLGAELDGADYVAHGFDEVVDLVLRRKPVL